MKIYLTKEYESDFFNVLREKNLKYTFRATTHDDLGGSITLLFIELIHTPEMWGALAAILIAWIKSKHNAEVIIVDKDSKITYAKDLSESELVRVLENADRLKICNEHENKSNLGQ